MVKKNLRSVKKGVKKLMKKSNKKPVKLSVKKLTKKQMKMSGKKLKLVSKKKRSRYLLQEGRLASRIKNKTKEELVAFVGKYPKAEKLMDFGNDVKKIASEYLDDLKTVASVGSELFKKKPNQKSDEEQLIQTSQQAAAQEINVQPTEVQKVQTYKFKANRLGLWGHEVKLPESFSGQKEIIIKEDRISGETFESQIEQAIRDNIPDLRNASITVIFNERTKEVRIDIEK